MNTPTLRLCPPNSTTALTPEQSRALSLQSTLFLHFLYPLLRVALPPLSPSSACFARALCMCLCHVVDRPSLWPLQYVECMEKKTRGCCCFCCCWWALASPPLAPVRTPSPLCPGKTPPRCHFGLELLTCLCMFRTRTKLLQCCNGGVVTQVSKSLKPAVRLFLWFFKQHKSSFKTSSLFFPFFLHM